MVTDWEGHELTLPHYLYVVASALSGMCTVASDGRSADLCKRFSAIGKSGWVCRRCRDRQFSAFGDSRCKIRQGWRAG